MGSWSTKSVAELLQRYDKSGVMPRDNPYYMGDTNYRKGDIKFGYTKEEMLEQAKCKVDIMHFAETHCTVMTDDGLRQVKMRPYQKKVLLQFKKYRFNVYLASRQIGKILQPISQIDIQIIVETSETNKICNIKIPLFELYYETKKRNIGLGFIDKVKRTLYRAICRLEGIHKYLHTEEFIKFTSNQ